MSWYWSLCVVVDLVSFCLMPHTIVPRTVARTFNHHSCFNDSVFLILLAAQKCVVLWINFSFSVSFWPCHSFYYVIPTVGCAVYFPFQFKNAEKIHYRCIRNRVTFYKNFSRVQHGSMLWPTKKNRTLSNVRIYLYVFDSTKLVQNI